MEVGKQTKGYAPVFAELQHRIRFWMIQKIEE